MKNVVIKIKNSIEKIKSALETAENIISKLRTLSTCRWPPTLGAQEFAPRTPLPGSDLPRGGARGGCRTMAAKLPEPPPEEDSGIQGVPES